MASTKSTKKIALFAIFSLVVPFTIFLIVAEIALRIILSYHTIYDIEMSRYAQGIKQDAQDPMIGHVHRPNAEMKLMDVNVKINSDGHRDQEYPLERTDKRRFIFIGDSLTFGWGVEAEDTFQHVLEQQLSEEIPTEVINFGTGNYNTTQEVHLFLRKGLRYQPDKVVLFYFINDAEPVPVRSKRAWLANFRVSTFYWSRMKSFTASRNQTGTFLDYYQDLYKADQPGWVQTQKSFLLLKQVCDRYDIELQVVILPELHNLIDYPFTKEHELISGFLGEHEIPCLDLAPSFAGEEDPMRLWVALDDAHPNAEAHHLIAKHSLAFIAENERVSE